MYRNRDERTLFAPARPVAETNRRPRVRQRSALAAVVVAAVLGIAPAVQAPTAAADQDYGGGCVLYADNPAATVDALHDHCSVEQQYAIFRAAPRGDVPTGVTDGWVTSPPVMETVAPPLWIGKTFYTGPDGGSLTNRITAAGIEGFPANVYAGPSRIDGQPAWLLDYAPSITPQILDEIRQITPGVWFGYSWWRGYFQTTSLLTFALTEQ
ncbi:hypothetical protein [Nocardia mikamii]|uniref:hypothetical protein n=1 Tax=Nocardia mikamii TaxID=508464 RepID=UPI000A9A01A0|nr:hypothetical protein [Nocardia mikamii]